MKKIPHSRPPTPRGSQLEFGADENLKRSLSLLQATLDSTADGILVVDSQGKIERFNKKFLEMWRIPPAIIESAEDDKAIAFVLDQLKDPEQFLKKVRDLYAQPDATSFDSLEFKDGRVFERYSQPQRIDGKSVGRVWSFRDITESAKAGRELHSSEKKFRALFENVLDGMYQSTPEGRLLMVNPALIRMLGYDSEEELLKADIATDLYMDPQQRLSLMKKYDLDGLVRSEELTLRRKDGAAITVLENSRTVRDDSGKILYYEGTLTDITEQKKAEQALRESEERYRQFFEQGLAGHFISTPSGKILACNPAFARMFGFNSVSDALSSQAYELYQNRESRDSYLNLLKEKRKLENFPLEMRRKDGTVLYVIEDVAATFDEHWCPQP
ncbi:MAG: multi-sensor hybrid histidine kinase [Bacteroidetes bacterium]|nr:multi-sensor hybrid histidine kinase [Bacteroidota bacterium]